MAPLDGDSTLASWMEVALDGGRDWRGALATSAVLLGARALCLIVDRAPVALFASPGAGSCDATDLACRLARAADGKPHASILADEPGHFAAAAANPRLRPRLWLVGLFDAPPPDLRLQAAADAAAGAFAAREKLIATNARRDLKSALFDNLPLALAIVDARLRLIESNEACRLVLKRADGLRLSGERLSCLARSDGRMLAASVAAAVAGTRLPAPVPVRRAGGKLPYTLCPLLHSHRDGRPLCALMIADPDGAGGGYAGLWRALSDISEAELAAAKHLLSGLDPPRPPRPGGRAAGDAAP